MREAVDGIPCEHPLPRAGTHCEADECRPGIDPHAEPQRFAPDRDQILGRLRDPDAGANRSFGIVLVGGGNPEDPDHRVSDEFLHDPAVRLDLGSGHRGIRREHLIHIFRIGGLGDGGEPDQVAEQGGDDLAFLSRGTAGGRLEGRGALHTELRPGRCRSPRSSRTVCTSTCSPTPRSRRRSNA